MLSSDVRVWSALVASRVVLSGVIWDPYLTEVGGPGGTQEGWRGCYSHPDGEGWGEKEGSSPTLSLPSFSYLSLSC